MIQEKIYSCATTQHRSVYCLENITGIGDVKNGVLQL